MNVLICRKVPTGDGIELATDVYLPSGSGPFPTILIRTPYHRLGAEEFGHRFAERGYATVAQDCRGRFDSDGIFRPLRDEARDGQCSLDWVANQRWCNGRIGLWGSSYLGITQIPAAAGGHEALSCIMPWVNPSSMFRDFGRLDGCFAPSLQWSFSTGAVKTIPPVQHFSWEEVVGLRTPEAMAEVIGVSTPKHLREWAEHDSFDDYWAEVDQDLMHEKIRVPGFHVGGWFDHFSRGQCIAYQNIRDRGATDEIRFGQKLVMGPWMHGNIEPEGPEHTISGDWEFGSEADLPVLTAQLQAMDFYMKDIDNGYLAQPAAKIFLMGDNRWISLSDWPPPDAGIETWYHHSSGSANSRIGDGVLDQTPPDTSYEDTYSYDPYRPVPVGAEKDSWNTSTFNAPLDLRSLLERPDVLYYRSPILDRPKSVVGEISLLLYIASSAEDTDYVAKLCVETTEGEVICLCRGCLRCKFRNSFSDPEPLKRGESTLLQIEMSPTAYTFPAGSRIGLMITSSDFPRIILHDNTLNKPWSGDNPIIARNSVLHGPETLSRIELPILET